MSLDRHLDQKVSESWNPTPKSHHLVELNYGISFSGNQDFLPSNLGGSRHPALTSAWCCKLSILLREAQPSVWAFIFQIWSLPEISLVFSAEALVFEKSRRNSATDETMDIDGWKWKARLAHTNGVSSPVLVLCAAVLKSYSATNRFAPGNGSTRITALATWNRDISQFSCSGWLSFPMYGKKLGY